MELKVGDIVRIDGDYFDWMCRGHVGRIMEENLYDYWGIFNGARQYISKDLVKRDIFYRYGSVTKIKPNKLNQKLYPEIKEFI